MEPQSPPLVRLTIDDQPVAVPADTTIWEAARGMGIHIPVLCHHPKLRPVAVCRVCAVDVEKSRVMPAACIRQVEEGIVVRTDTDRVRRARKTLVELLLAEHPTPCAKHARSHDCELELLGEQLDITSPRFSIRPSSFVLRPFPPDPSSAVIAVDLNACILCDRCIRACDEVQVNEVIGRAEKGHRAHIVFDDGKPMGESTCVSCGECQAYCPTGALIDKPLMQVKAPSTVQTVDSVCPYCGVGCGVTYHVHDNTIVQVTGRTDGHTEGRLCVKGRYGFDYSHHPQRLTVPLIRKDEAYPKQPLSADFTDYKEFRDSLRSPEWNERIRETFREATWDEALDLSARRLMDIKTRFGSGALAGFGSAKVTNEEAYLFQKLIRTVFGTNNVDHCTRLCHASSVAALMETIGSGAVSNIFQEALDADVLLVIGSNANENHPVAATYFKQAAKRGVTLIVMDPRRPPLANQATHYVRFKPGTDVALLNGLMHVILRDGLHDDAFVRERTENFEALREMVQQYPPDVVEKITGVPREMIERIAFAYGRAERAMIFWGMGISQHTTGTDNARCLISLCLLTGNIGRRGTGLHPLRGQNNVQGASDVGLIPFALPGYQRVDDLAVRTKFERAWGVPLDPRPGLTVVEIMHAALHGDIKGMLMMGENPFLSDPNMNKVRKALQALDFLVVQDIFLTETAEFADVILPASTAAEKEGTYVNTNRMVQLGRKAVDPPGQARIDGDILIDLANRMMEIEAGVRGQGSGVRKWEYRTSRDVWDEIVPLTPLFDGITYDEMARRTVIWPHDEQIIFTQTFPRGRGKFVPAEFAPANELPDAEYPFVLNTGRVLQHWHTGTMTRRTKALDEIAPEPFVEVAPDDLTRLGVRDGDWVTVASRRGVITLRTKASTKVSPGSVFIPFHFKEAAVNLLTNDALDPYGKIPEFKFCAVRVEKAR
ncbi:MAG: formate dehydrogenase subunit alpha [Candidatus Latescibacteria bacterium]|nr:formate dehydrogenase subunit alpha [Candidatus Latescibacterota bacterium]